MIKDYKKRWPCCMECGCRLDVQKVTNDSWRASHFGYLGDKDARGCKCKLINMFVYLRGDYGWLYS